MSNEKQFSDSDKMALVIFFSNFRSELVDICNATSAKDDVEATFFDFGQKNPNMVILDHVPSFINNGEISAELKNVGSQKTVEVINRIVEQEVANIERKIKNAQLLPKSSQMITAGLEKRKEKIVKMFDDLMSLISVEFQK